MKGVFEILAEIFREMRENLFSAIVGIDIKALKRTIQKVSSRESDSNSLTENFDKVTEKLQESKSVIEDALRQVEEQRKLTEKQKEEAEASKQIASMNQEQMAAVTKILEKSLGENDKSSFRRDIIMNIVFCLISAALGYIIGKL